MNADDTAKLLDAFGAAWNDHDLDAALALTTDDIVFESTSPSPDGERSEGRDAVRAAWAPIFADTNARFETEDLVIAGDRAFSRWTYRWDGGHVRGVDVFAFRDGLVAEKFSYVKG
jgi:ketosteroid isomerase-like protein